MLSMTSTKKQTMRILPDRAVKPLGKSRFNKISHLFFTQIKMSLQMGD